ncbi:MAG: cytochrome c3 family protein [Desulfovibrionaceae bacterium]|nr:cytochrome c3 family protein [Desulfovibrionaceae bacterium]MDD4952264.1 cytochrome c3 family protein [Desulfovibrionaceae bacterium]
MEEKRASKGSGGAIPFLIGFVLSAVFLWIIFPQVIYCQKDQPIRFSHTVHKEQGMECSGCHFFREDGSYAGLPSNEQCAECHTDLMGQDPAEAKYVKEFLEKGRAVPWLIYQYQPDNVYFSHKAHDGFECTDCHPNLGDSDTPPPHYRNVITGYSKQTMKMWQCERCHAEGGVSNACYVCHK